MRIRIIERPREREIEGVSLDLMRPGTICDVSASVGTWLIVQGYAYPEMRQSPDEVWPPEPRPRAARQSDRRRRRPYGRS